MTLEDGRLLLVDLTATQFVSDPPPVVVLEASDLSAPCYKAHYTDDNSLYLMQLEELISSAEVIAMVFEELVRVPVGVQGGREMAWREHRESVLRRIAG